MMRLLALAALALIGTTAMAQDPLDGIDNLVPNPGFEEGTTSWTVTQGPYGDPADRWAAAKGMAEIVDGEADAGERCLLLDATDLDHEVDVRSEGMPVEGGRLYLLEARVRQLAGEAGYKVTIDWIGADGEHIEYANDWKGTEHPAEFSSHGGVFISPDDAAEAFIIIGASKGVECRFDEIRLSELPVGPGQTVPDGSGTLDAVLSRTVEAGGHATLRFTYTAGPGGLPVGARLELRRTNTDPSWSPTQTASPRAAGYTTAKASNGARLLVQPGGATVVPSVTGITVQYPPLAEGDTVTITYGDTAEGGPGAQAQTTAEPGVRFALALDGDVDGRGLDVGETDAFDVVAGEFRALGLIAPVLAEVGREFTVTVEARDAYGNLVPDFAGKFSIDSEGSRRAGEATFSRNDGGRHAFPITFGQPGTRALTVESMGAKATQEIVVVPAPTRPTGAQTSARAYEAGDTLVIANRHVRLLLPKTEAGYGPGILEAAQGNEWRRVGVFRSMGDVWTDDGERVPIYLPDARCQGATATLAGKAAGGKWDCEATLSLDDDARHVGIALEATATGDTSLRALYAPVLYAGDGSFGASKDGALFPGLEYLTADEVSSGNYGIVPPYSDRTAPHPYKITVPMMAVAADGLGAMLSWDPTREWQPGHRAPTAVFGSPARLVDRDDHMMGIYAPSQFDGVPENARLAEEPYEIEAGTTLSLEVQAAALTGVADITEVFRYWVDTHGLPDVPTPPRSEAEEDRLIATAFTEAAWDPEEKGWHSALADPWGAAYNGQIALWLRQALLIGEGLPTEAMEECLEEAGGVRGFDAAFVTGGAADVVAGERGQAMRDILAMAPDGSYAFHPHAGNKQFSQAQSRSMGADGEVVVGTCVMGLEPLAKRAMLTGDPTAIAALERGLAFIDQYSRPQGSEHWEVPLACPNLRAAALATRCYLYGYLLTEKEAYLEKARFWATTGLPFIYLWQAPDREVMPYASISVMGTTLHTHTWFGNAVQWVGLVYADALEELARHDDSFPWRQVAEGILVSAMEQQKLPGAECDHVGFYPDSWTLMDGDEAYHWCLAPILIAQVSDALRGVDPRARATIVLHEGRPIPIVTADEVAEASFDGSTLRCRVRRAIPDFSEIVLSVVAGAEGVTVDGQALTEADWGVSRHGTLWLRPVSDEDTVEVVISGCALSEGKAAGVSVDLTNGGFEDGMVGWSASGAAAVSPVPEAYEGDAALALDARDATGEVQCNSAPIRVEAGRTYRLRAFVKATDGEGDYKVTIDWQGPNGHIAYANDWEGDNHPAEFTEHGGEFVAPEGAVAAVIILGVRPETRCVFDGIELRPVD